MYLITQPISTKFYLKSHDFLEVWYACELIQYCQRYCGQDINWKWVERDRKTKWFTELILEGIKS